MNVADFFADRIRKTGEARNGLVGRPKGGRRAVVEALIGANVVEAAPDPYKRIENLLGRSLTATERIQWLTVAEWADMETE